MIEGLSLQTGIDLQTERGLVLCRIADYEFPSGTA